MNRKQRKKLIRILTAAVLLLVLSFVSLKGGVRLAAYLVPYLVVGYDILIKAWKGIKNRQPFDESLLMAVATIGAFAIAACDSFRGGILGGLAGQEQIDYTEAVAVMLFYQVGEWFQSYAVGRSRRNISELMDIRPDYANIESGRELVQVDPDQVETGSVIVVRPGEKVPIDGVVLEGSSSLDTGALTGESLPREVAQDDEVLSGCINLTGVLRIRTTREFGESTVSKILDLVENASSRKAKSEEFITKFARVYTPAVVISALALAFLPPLVRILAMGLEGEWLSWIYRALTFLVISCPCALVISIPLSFFAGIGGAGRAGILIKGSNYMETLARTRSVVFDKTGTLTQGVFEVDAIHHNRMEEQQLLEYAALAESASSHPISRSLQRACGKEPDLTRVSDIREISGKGVTAQVDGRMVAAGNEKLMAQLGISPIDCHRTGTIIHMAIDGEYAGHIVISDLIKPHAGRAVEELKRLGVEHTVMLTGDARKVAENVAEHLGIEQVYSQLLPADKVARVEELLREKKPGTKLAFVGDGINDAPVLSLADVGIAMGAMGSDAAIEAADVVLMDDDPLKIVRAIRHSRKCMRIVYQNIWFAIGVKGACLLLGAAGIAGMWLAIFADVGVMILAVLNAMRALFAGEDKTIGKDGKISGKP